MPVKLENHPKVRTSAGLPLMGGNIYKASINGLTVLGWFFPIQGGLTVNYTNDTARHKKDGWTVLVDYDDPAYTATFRCLYSIGQVGPGKGATTPTGISTGGFVNPPFGSYDPHTGRGILVGAGNPAISTGGGPPRLSPTQTGGSNEDFGTPTWTFSVGDVWRFWVDTRQSDRGPSARSRTDFVGVNLLLEPGTSWSQPANGFWQLSLNFINLLGSPAMYQGKKGWSSSVQRTGATTRATTTPGRTN